jgi:hypothetical protein
MSCEILVVVQPRRPASAVAATTTWKTVLRPVTAAVMRSVYGDWHEDPAQLQALIVYHLQQARPGDA